MDKLLTSSIEITSLDIAEIVGKKHFHIMRDIRNEIDELGDEVGASIFGLTSYADSQNKEQPCYTFGKDGAMQLALKYDAMTRFRVIKRIEELENQSSQQTIPQVSSAELIAMIAQQGLEQERRITVVEEKQDNIVSILSMDVKDWRNQANRIINAIVMKLGGGEYYREVRNESYQLLESRGACNLDIRLENRHSKMALRGSSKTAINKVTKLDVIAEDKKLISVYITVIKELAVKYQLNLAKYQLTETAGV
ncbi:Rha family transcriptional regulator [Sporosarcina sp. FSL K6-1508]|uniref:Rha family transcriptional regulator n=1 Tax=Sporosarcina sp. FSL K6-1508 TaxID=2921553 RepID=UPI0030F5CD43